MAITQQTDYAGEGLGRLLQQFKNKPRIAALLGAWLAEVQEVEDNAFLIYTQRQIQDGNAADDLLDKIGAIVGQERLGYSDAIYARLITTRIKVNRSDGRRETLIDIATLLIPSTRILVEEYIGSVYIEPIGAIVSPVVPEVIARDFLGRAVAAGIELEFVYTVAIDDDTFVYADVTGGTTTGKGYGDTVAGLVGGVYSSVIAIVGTP